MAIDETKDYTSADVLTLDDALSLAVMGYRVRAVDMQPGAYIDYQFAGWRINFPGGSSSGWSRRPHDETVNWHVIDEPEPVKSKDAWGRPNDASYVAAVDKLIGAAPKPAVVSKDWALDPGKKALAVPPPVADVLVMGDGGKWGSAAPTPAPAPDSVGKWGKALPPTKDKWGR